MLRLALALAVVAGCGGSTDDVALQLQDDCDAAQLQDITVLSVEVYGDSDGQLCILRQRCIFDLDQPQSSEDLSEAMRDANPPLVDFEADDARAIGVIGHATSCWGVEDRVACGFNDLAQVSDGTLTIALTCGMCDDVEVPFCP